MKSSWVKGLEPDQAKQVGDAYDASALLRSRLVSMLTEKYDVCERNSVSKEGYDSPNWAFKKADEVGYKRALSEILKII